MKDARRRSRRVLGAVVPVVAVLIIGAWFAGRGNVQVPMAAPVPTSASSAQDAAVTPKSEAPPGPLAIAAAPAAEKPVPPGWMPVCGRPPIPIDDGRNQASARLTAEVLLPQQAAWAKRLLDSGEPRKQAAGLLLMRQKSIQLAHPLAMAQGAKACAKEAACLQGVERDARARSMAAQRASLDPLVRLALESGDVAIYGLAAKACDSDRSIGGACAQVSLAQWARLDPDNMEAWLQGAGRADLDKDEGAALEALHRATAAPRHDSHGGLLMEALLASRPPDLHPATEMQVMMELLGGGWNIGNFGAASAGRHCQASQLGDANRRALCDGLARALVDRGTSLMERNSGIRIGERAGWPAERIAALKKDDDTLRTAMADRLPADERIMGCSSRTALRDYAAAWARGGELAAMRAALSGGAADRSGSSAR